jgi:hypothetical protein
MSKIIHELYDQYPAPVYPGVVKVTKKEVLTFHWTMSDGEEYEVVTVDEHITSMKWRGEHVAEEHIHTHPRAIEIVEEKLISRRRVSSLNTKGAKLNFLLSNGGGDYRD